MDKQDKVFAALVFVFLVSGTFDFVHSIYVHQREWNQLQHTAKLFEKWGAEAAASPPAPSK